MITNERFIYRILSVFILRGRIIGMKQKVSITIDEKTLKLIEESLQEGFFRNRSHVIEFSVNKMLKENQEEEGK